MSEANEDYLDRLVRIPDPIERGEMRAEAAYDEMIQPDGRMKCACGELFDPDNEGETLTPDPYAMPFCRKCCEGHFNSANSALSNISPEEKR